MSSLAPLIVQAQATALAKLIVAVEATNDPAEIRRLSELILKLDPRALDHAAPPLSSPRKPPSASMPSPTPDSAPAGPPPAAPLTRDELDRLRKLLPHMRPERFTRKHNPDYWRTILARHPPAQAA